MSFADFRFLPFLLAVLVLVQAAPGRGRIGLLLLASYVFYCAWRPEYGLLLAASSVLDFVVGRALGRAERPGARRVLLLCSIAGNLGLLGFFKYAGFALQTMRALLGTESAPAPGWVPYVLPVGISFYTFQTMSYTIDVYRRRIEPCRNFLLYMLYVSFFPQLVAGPIERAAHLLPQLTRLQRYDRGNYSLGFRLILWGFVKKLVLADTLLVYGAEAYRTPELFAPVQLWLATASLLTMVYADFSAYTDIARGTARLFGVELMENFRRPFLATNIMEFWRRWHISLTSWVADYVYAPLGGVGRNHLRNWRNALVAWGAIGLWHGASWHFVAWGLLNGVAVAGYHSWSLLRGRRRRLARRRSRRVTTARPEAGEFVSIEPGAVPTGGARRVTRKAIGPREVTAWAGTMLLTTLLTVFFFGQEMDRIGRILCGMFVPAAGGVGWSTGELAIGAGILALALALHALPAAIDVRARWQQLHPALRAAGYASLIYLLIFWGVREPAKFVYFQF